MSVVITPSSGSAVTFTDAPANFAENNNVRYWLTQPIVAMGKYGIYPCKSPNVVGQQVKRTDFDSREISGLQVIYIASDAAAAHAMLATDHAALRNKACAVQIAAGTFPACELTQCEALRDRFGRLTIPNWAGGTVRLKALFSFIQLRLE